MNIAITGATGGLGMALVSAFMARQDKVIAIGRRLGALADLSSDPCLKTIQCDFMKGSDIQNLVGQLRALDVDVIINAACTDKGVGPVETIPLDEWEENFSVNLFAAVKINNAVIPGMKERRRGLIINVSSAAGFTPLPWLSAYSASKAALHSYTKSLSFELKEFGIRANSLSILADTPLYASHKKQKQDKGYYALYPPHKRIMPSAEDNVGTFLFLASEEGKHLTGQYIECISF